MGLLTLEKFRKQVELRARRTAEAELLDQLINDAVLEVATLVRFRELRAVHPIATVQADIDYTLPTDLHYFTNARIISPVDRRGRVRRLTEDEYFIKVDWDSEGIVTHYLEHKNLLFVYPAPDSTVMNLEFAYQKLPAALALNTAVSPLPVDWDEAVVLGARYRLFDAFLEQDRALIAKNFFTDHVRNHTPAIDEEEWPDAPLGVAREESDLVT